MYTLTDEQFEAAIQSALDAIPEEFLEDLENVAFLTADEPTEDDLQSDGSFNEAGELLGLYDGLSLAERDSEYGLNDYPDTITIFKGPHERMCDTYDQIMDEIYTTVVHEVAHYFGMDEDQVDEMGYA